MNILLIGCGRMGGALATSWIQNGFEVSIVDPQKPDIDAVYYSDIKQVKGRFDAVILAVKPHFIADVTKAIAGYLNDDGFILSVAAGKTIADITKFLPDVTQTGVIRTMPNTPCAIGQGITVLVASPHTTPQQKQRAEQLMQAGGQTIWLDDEAQLHAVTALSGSGPAYIFHFLECLSQAGVSLGLPKETALKLAKTTLIGSGLLAKKSSEDLVTLRENVTSPNGTTAAGLRVLMESLPDLINQTLTTAAHRSKELSQ